LHIEPYTYDKVIEILEWHKALEDEIEALKINNTWFRKELSLVKILDESVFTRSNTKSMVIFNNKKLV